MNFSILGRTFKTFNQNPLTNSFSVSPFFSILEYFWHILSFSFLFQEEKLRILTTKFTICGLSYVWVPYMIPLLSCFLRAFLSDDSFSSLCKYVLTASVLKIKLFKHPLLDTNWSILSCSLPFF